MKQIWTFIPKSDTNVGLHGLREEAFFHIQDNLVDFLV